MSTKRRPRTIPLTPVLVAEVQQRIDNIREKERDLLNARDALNWLLYQATGADLGKEDWTLDLDHWLLERNS